MILFTLLLFTPFLIRYTEFTGQITIEEIQEKKELAEQKQVERYDKALIRNWIVELEDEPLIVVETNYEKEKKIKKPKEDKGTRLQGQKIRIEQEQKRLIKEAEKITKNQNKDSKTFKNVLNAFTVKAAPREIAKIRSLSGVKEVYEDKISFVTLNVSVPLIGADQVWNLTDIYGNNITGKNVTIAVLDTGIDYNHSDLGNCTDLFYIDGTNESHSLDSPHNYTTNYNNTWTITKPGYAKIAVHFSNISTENNYDYIYVLNENDTVLQTITGDYQDRWSYSANGDTIKINLVTDYSVVKWGFEIDYVLNGSQKSNYTKCGNKIIGGYDFVNDDLDPIDDHGHGTHVSATAAGNGTLLGVAPDASIIAYKICTSSGSCPSSNQIAAFERATDPNQDGNFSDHVDVLSLSVGGSGNPNDAKSIALDNAVKLGVVAVVAAGNDGPGYFTVNSPGTSRLAITVGASNDADTVQTSFSGMGPTSIGTLKPDVVAPGVEICAARWNTYKPSDLCLDSKHVSIDGTSMATPHVSGLVALMLQKNRNRTPEEIKMILRGTAVDLGNEPASQGMGRVDALAAVNFNNTYPVAILNSSGYTYSMDLDLYTHSGIINITGVAKSDNFTNYSLYYATGPGPSNWTLLQTNTSQVINGLLGVFDTGLLIDGYASIRLVVRNSNNLSSEDRLILILNNFELVFPPTTQTILKTGDALEVRGSAYSATLENFTVMWKNNSVNSTWSTQGVTLVGGGLTSVLNNTLAYINTSLIGKDGLYSLILVLNTDNFSVNSTGGFILDSKLMNGWPYWTDMRFTAYSPGIGELSKEASGKEIVIGDSFEDSYDAKIYAFYLNGSLMPGWPVNTHLFETGTPLLVDINSDGIDEIFVSAGTWSEGAVYGLYANGTNITGWPKTFTEDIESLNIIRINDSIGIVAYDYDATIYVWYPNGTNVTGWPINLAGITPTNLNIVDLDGDGSEDIIGGSQTSSKLYALSINGSNLTGWPVTADINSFTSPVIGDLDNNGDLEVVIGGDNKEIFVFNHDGTNFSGWPITPNIDFGDFNEFSLADLDNDSDLEIIGIKSFDIFIFHHNATNFTGWPNYDKGARGGEGVTIGDIDGDGEQEILSPMYYYWDDFWAYEVNASNVTGWPLLIPEDDTSDWIIWYYAAVLDDLDRDGDLEVIVAREHHLMIWDLNASYNPRLIQWGRPYADNRLSGLYKNPKRLPHTLSFNADTTLFENEYDITNVKDAVLEKKDIGRIVFSQTLNFTSLNLDEYINISDNYASINTTALPELNTSAIITFYNVSLTAPKILVDENLNGTWIDCATCGVMSYSNNDLVFNVTSFSAYKAINDTPPVIITMNMSDWSNQTTNLTGLNESELENISEAVFDNTYGTINYTSNLSITTSINFSRDVIISPNSITINSVNAPDMNIKATLTLTGLSYLNPKILRDASDCSALICQEVSYAGGVFVFNVSGFSTYQAAETPYCGDATCNNGEDCNSCSADCGSCYSGGGGGGSSSVSYQDEEIIPVLNTTTTTNTTTEEPSVESPTTIQENQSLGQEALLEQPQTNLSNTQTTQNLMDWKTTEFWVQNSFTLIIVLSTIFAILILSALSVYSYHAHHKADKPIYAKSLNTFIKAAKKKGLSKEKIKKILKSKGWKKEIIEKQLK
ncbi:S8 family serine peptidase [Candidatus Woesearchaeota archaeon]|nr:S8 family serine peptidase [Candidatus Woesearchaeota archaeon]